MHNIALLTQRTTHICTHTCTHILTKTKRQEATQKNIKNVFVCHANKTKRGEWLNLTLKQNTHTHTHIRAYGYMHTYIDSYVIPIWTSTILFRRRKLRLMHRSPKAKIKTETKSTYKLQTLQNCNHYNRIVSLDPPIEEYI